MNMEDKSIIDRLKVTRTALQNASSVATMSLITESLVTDIPEKGKLPPPPPPPEY
jgi:chaperonin GroEL